MVRTPALRQSPRGGELALQLLNPRRKLLLSRSSTSTNSGGLRPQHSFVSFWVESSRSWGLAGQVIAEKGSLGGAKNIYDHLFCVCCWCSGIVSGNPESWECTTAPSAPHGASGHSSRGLSQDWKVLPEPALAIAAVSTLINLT